MNKRILIAIVALVLVTLACGIPATTPATAPDTVSTVPLTTVSQIDYDEIICPVDTPTGYSESKCYELSNYSYGAVFYKGSIIKALGLIIDVDYSSSALNDTVDFTANVIEEAGWDEDDILRATQKLSDVEIGDIVTAGDIKASMDISGNQYLLIMYAHK